MLAEITGQQALLDVAAFLGAVTVILGVAAGLAKTSPVKWLGRTLIGVPVAAWFRRELADEVRPIIEQLQPNGGSSTRDAIDRMERRLDDLADAVAPVLRDWRLGHPEARPDLDDDGGQTT